MCGRGEGKILFVYFEREIKISSFVGREVGSRII